MDRKRELLTLFPDLSCSELHELRSILEGERENYRDNAYLLALALMLADVNIELSNKGERCTSE